MTTEAYIGLGSNLGDRLAHISAALSAIVDMGGAHVIKVSNVVESEPWGVRGQPAFANAVAQVATTLRADQLLQALKEIEAAVGRASGQRYGPRVIDLDILLFGDEEWIAEGLTIPHPRLAGRDFAVTPLLEIAPEVRWPDGTRITRDEVTFGRVTGVLGPVPGFETITPPQGGWVAAERPEGGSWEEVASSDFAPRRGATHITSLLFDAAMLAQQGIPIAWDPMPPDEECSPWSLPRPYRLLVPGPMATRARRVLLEARAGIIVTDEDSWRVTESGEGKP